MTRVKVCGITNKEDAIMCAEMGADLIGCIVDVPVKTPRRVSAKEARKIFGALPDHITSVVVTMAEDAAKVIGVLEATGASTVQLHGGEPLDIVKEVRSRAKAKVIKTIHVTGEESIEEAGLFAGECDALLLETPSKNLGGSGRTHDWAVSGRIVEAVDVPVILSGGLTPGNIEKAVMEVRPHAVDVSSGLEAGPGQKDYLKVMDFIQKVKGTK